MKRPLVSVVLPTYKRPGKLRDAVDSVLGQTYDPVELVVVDDHSPTPASETLSDTAFGDTRGRIIRHVDNRGANEARNTGIEASNGEYVAFLDDDDTWRPKKLAEQVSTFRESGSAVGVVYTGTEYVYDDYSRSYVYTLSGDVTTDLLQGGKLGEFTTLMVQRDVIAKAGLPDTRFPSWQDRDWMIRLSRHCEFGVVTEPLTVRNLQMDNESISDNFEAKRDVSYPLLLEKHRETAGEYGLEDEFVAATSEALGRTALKYGYYDDARKYLLKALYCDPTKQSRWAYSLASLGGVFTYRPAKELVRIFHEVRDRPTVR